MAITNETYTQIFRDEMRKCDAERKERQEIEWQKLEIAADMQRAKLRSPLANPTWGTAVISSSILTSTGYCHTPGYGASATAIAAATICHLPLATSLDGDAWIAVEQHGQTKRVPLSMLIEKITEDVIKTLEAKGRYVHWS